MSARDRILQRLRERPGLAAKTAPSDYSMVEARPWQLDEKLDRFQANLESVHGEVHRVKRSEWLLTLSAVLEKKAVRNMLVARQHQIGREIRNAAAPRMPELLDYEQPVEEWRETLFTEVDAGITSTRGGIAETGSLILWPTADEPRLMSLVPALHIAVVDAETIYGTFFEAMRAQRWAEAMPTNALLVSGPSKTADIEQTLAYGVHGPRELLVLLRLP